MGWPSPSSPASFLTPWVCKYTGATKFADVASDAYYAKAVEWAVDNGITKGTSDTTFSPNKTVTREQIAVFVHNALYGGVSDDKQNAHALDKFTDKDDISPWAVDAMKWAAGWGIIRGDDGKLKPRYETTRAMFATILMNYDEYAGIKPEEPTPDPDPNPNPDPDPTPTPDPDPGTDPDVPEAGEFERNMEQKINGMLIDTWKELGAKPSKFDAGELSDAARLLASAKETDTEKALRAVGFDKPIGTYYENPYKDPAYLIANKYTTSRYDARNFSVTVSSPGQAMAYFKAKENLMDTYTFTDYGIACHIVDDIQADDGIRFRVSVVTYGSAPYTFTDTPALWADWYTQQQAKPMDISAEEQKVLDLVNQERAKEGLSPLIATADMQKAAHIRAEELTIFFDHGRPGGGMGTGAMEDVGIPIGCGWFTSENIAAGFNTPEAVMTGWMNSSGHRDNMMKPGAKYVGIGQAPCYKNGVLTGYCWVQLFIPGGSSD